MKKEQFIVIYQFINTICLNSPKFFPYQIHKLPFIHKLVKVLSRHSLTLRSYMVFLQDAKHFLGQTIYSMATWILDFLCSKTHHVHINTCTYIHVWSYIEFGWRISQSSYICFVVNSPNLPPQIFPSIFSRHSDVCMLILTTCLGMLVSYFNVKFFFGRAILYNKFIHVTK